MLYLQSNVGNLLGNLATGSVTDRMYEIWRFSPEMTPPISCKLGMFTAHL